MAVSRSSRSSWSSRSSSPSPWIGLPLELSNNVDPTHPDEEDMYSILGGLGEMRRGEAYLAWARLQSIGVLYDRLVAARADRDGLVVDGFADAVAHICGVYAISRYRAQEMLNDAVALRDKMPDTFMCLRDGVIAADQAHLILSRTELVDVDNPAAPQIDAAIATTLRTRKGTWKRDRLRDMADRIVFRHDPDLVRERRKDALAGRGVWTDNHGEGTGSITAVMAAEDIRLAAHSVRALADNVCEHDRRTVGHRAADAMFALLTGTAFECHCGRDDCTAVIPEPTTMVPADPGIVIHVVCNEAALDTDTGTVESEVGIGFMDGYGIISDEHVRELAQRPDAVIRRMVVPGTPVDSDGTFVLPAHQPADPYRPSTALDEGIRVRDGYCADPGCHRSAWSADIDHVAEYDHRDPGVGGVTREDNLNAKCRYGHLQKTFGDWTDDQYRDHDGRLVTSYISPSGYVIDGDAETFEDTFAGLRRIRFQSPNRDGRNQRRDRTIHDDPRRRGGTRAANKHARRRAERRRNRIRNRIANTAGGDPPY